MSGIKVDQLGVSTTRRDDAVAGIVNAEERDLAIQRFERRVELFTLSDWTAEILLVVDE